MNGIFTKYSVFLAVTLLTISAPVSAENKTEEPLNIGMLLCLSSNCADWGDSALKGAQLASKEINTQGGVLGRKIVLTVEDTRESVSGAQAVSGFQKLTTINNLKFIIGPSWSPGALSIAPIAAKRDDILIITPSASAEEFSKTGKNIFNMRPTERLATNELAKFSLKRGWKKGAVLTSTQPAESVLGNIFKDTFIKLGGSITRYIETDPTAPDIRAETLQVVSSKPDVIFLMAYNQMESALKSLRGMGYSGSIAMISLDEARIIEAKGLLEGIIVANNLPPTSEFVTRFKSEYHQPPGLSAENGYDSILALTKAIVIANSDNPRDIAKTLAEIKFIGASGSVQFNEDRRVIQPPALYRIIGKKLVSVN